MLMTKLSSFRKLTILTRVIGQSASRNRTLSAIFKGARTTAAHFGRVLHQLWLEVTGFVFLALAFIGAAAFFANIPATWRDKPPPVAWSLQLFSH